MVFALVFSFAGCDSTESDIKKMIKNFEASCNVLDLNEMLNYINPSVAKTFNLAADIANLFTNTDTETMLDKIAAILTSEDGWSGKDFFSSIHIEIRDIAVNGETAFAMTTIYYTMFDEAQFKDVTLRCVCKEEKWYISGFEFN